MKISILILLFVGATFLGCSDDFDNTLISTPNQNEITTNPLNFKELITLDIHNNPVDQVIVPLVVASKSINGQTGGEFIIDTTYVNYQGRLLHVFARIFVHEFTFQGTTEFTMILHPEEATVQFYPHMVFDQPVRVSVWYEGVDLKALGYNTNGHVDFAYFDDAGSVEIITAQQTHVNIQQSTIKVLNAQLHHFSRYGWVR